MAVAFGFSAGDFIAGLELVGTVIDALRESSHAGSSFRALIQELYALETALLNVKRLELDESQHADQVALRNAASQCQRTIDGFWTKIQKYQPHLRDRGTNSRLKDGWMKIKWAVCRQDDVDTFRAEIRGHTSSLEMLLKAVHMRATAIGQAKSDAQNRSMVTTLQSMFSQMMRSLGHITSAIAETAQQGKALLESSTQIIQYNIRTFHAVNRLETLLHALPPQIMRQQPVYLVDALNKECPFHLEFIRSVEALLSVLKVNLQASGCGPGMIDRGEFVIEDTVTHSLIDISRDWETCFFPGQRVAMSMVFVKRVSGTCCPQCKTDYSEGSGKEVICTICGVVFRQIDYLGHPTDTTFTRPTPKHSKIPMFFYFMPLWGIKTGIKRSIEYEDGRNIREFRRIIVVNVVQYKNKQEAMLAIHAICLATMAPFAAACSLNLSFHVVADGVFPSAQRVFCNRSG
ncbi:hypothetical protein BJX64DRAFT_53429 [Aspergillus heterothallicus]